MDNFLLQAIVDELAPILIGQRLSKVYQPRSTELLLDFKSSRALVISVDPEALGVYLGTKKPSESARHSAPPPFAARLRKHLGSGKLIDITKLGDDRVVFLDFRVVDDDGSVHLRRLCISLTGRSADVALIEQGVVVASLHDRGEGEPFELPAPATDKVDPFLLTDDAWLELVNQHGGDVTAAAARLLGFTRPLIKELTFLSEQRSPVTALRQVLDLIEQGPASGLLYSTLPIEVFETEPGTAELDLTLTSILLEHLSAAALTRFSSINAAAERYFRMLNSRRAFLSTRQERLTQLRARLKKNKSLRDKLQSDLLGCGDPNEHQRQGDLLLANLHQVTKENDEFIVTDYFNASEPRIRIPATKTDDPKAAADNYFKAARRARSGLRAINARLPVVDAEIEKLEAATLAVATATSFSSLDTPTSKPEGTGTARRTQSKKAAERDRIQGVRRYRSSEGYEILVGRTDRDNDHLTLKVARSTDLWFHAADYPGSHVVLRNPQRKPVPSQSVREAAELAAKFSQAKEDAKVAVNYCERKFVSKPKGFAPGQVRLASFKTILVQPREAGERVL